MMVSPFVLFCGWIEVQAHKGRSRLDIGYLLGEDRRMELQRFPDRNGAVRYRVAGLRGSNHGLKLRKLA